MAAQPMPKGMYSVRRTSGQVVDWDKADVLRDFHYPWDDGDCPETIFRALWDNEHFYFRFDAVDTNVHVWHNDGTKMDVTQSDRVEIFFMSGGNMSPYYCLEIDPEGRVLDIRARHHRQFDYTFQWPGIKIDTQRSVQHYSVEGTLSLSTLREFGILQNKTIIAGLYRANCTGRDNEGAHFQWISWQQPDSDEPDFHIPSSFGKMELVG
jgi:hypothetical protein